MFLSVYLCKIRVHVYVGTLFPKDNHSNEIGTERLYLSKNGIFVRCELTGLRPGIAPGFLKTRSAYTTSSQ